jgi:hypothetical protein
MGNRFRHAQHIVRVAGLFAFGLLAFLVLRAVLIPKDFGVLGFYRAGALPEIAARPIVYAGRTACLDCHGDIVPPKSVHQPLGCEGCHGPLAAHAGGNFDVKPKTLNPRTLCLTCHAKVTGKPATFPQIVPADHAGDGPCTACHTPHNPKIQ